MLQFFPVDPAAQSRVMLLLMRMCPHREALEWLVREMIDRVGQWRGPAEMRALLCTRYRPADGVEHAVEH